MSEPENSSELFLRFTRRSMFATLLIVLVMGTLSVMLAVSPHGPAARFLSQAPWFLPVAIILMIAVTHGSLRAGRWNAQSPEVKAVMGDEWRRTNMDRAMRITFVVILLAQVPLGLSFSFAGLPPLRALMAMAASTITIALALLATLFLIFDRD